MITTQNKFALNKLALIFHLVLALLLLLILPLVLILVLILTSNTLLAKTELYTIQELPFFDKEFDKDKLQVKEPKICYLDFTSKALSKINREMSKEVNKEMNKNINAAIDDAEMNTGINNEEIDKILHKSLIEQISDNLQCRFRAATLGITKVPAVVIDDKVVVYAVEDRVPRL